MSKVLKCHKCHNFENGTILKMKTRTKSKKKSGGGFSLFSVKRLYIQIKSTQEERNSQILK